LSNLKLIVYYHYLCELHWNIVNLNHQLFEMLLLISIEIEASKVVWLYEFCQLFQIWRICVKSISDSSIYIPCNLSNDDISLIFWHHCILTILTNWKKCLFDEYTNDAIIKNIISPIGRKEEREGKGMEGKGRQTISIFLFQYT
jgi:hypothetical protein